MLAVFAPTIRRSGSSEPKITVSTRVCADASVSATAVNSHILQQDRGLSNLISWGPQFRVSQDLLEAAMEANGVLDDLGGNCC